MDDDPISFDDRVSRRGALIGTAFGAVFALAAQPTQAQTIIVTPSDGLVAGAVSVKTRDGKDMMAYRAMPASGAGFGTILVTQEIFGVRQLTSAVSDDAPPRKVGLGGESGTIVVGNPVCGLPSEAWICLAMTMSAAVYCAAPICCMLAYINSAPALLPKVFQIAELKR